MRGKKILFTHWMNRTEKIKDKITCVMTEIQNSNEIGCCDSDQLYAY